MATGTRLFQFSRFETGQELPAGVEHLDVLPDEPHGTDTLQHVRELSLRIRILERRNTWHWNRGRRVFELVAPGGTTYVMQSFAQIRDPRLTLPSHLRVEEASIRSWLRALEVPTFVLCAEPSPPYFGPELRDARVAEVPQAQLALLDGGHHLHMEQPQAVAALLRPFLLSA